MDRLDYFEIAMYREKWMGLWFLVKDHDNYFAGHLDEPVYRGEPKSAVWVTLFHERGSKRLPVWIHPDKDGPATFTTLDEQGQTALANAEDRRKLYTGDGLSIRSTTGKHKDYMATKPMTLDFSFPEPGLVTMLRGAHKGYSYYIRRVPCNMQKRGCYPGYNLELSPIDETIMNEEGMDTLVKMDYDMKNHIYSDLYYSLVHTKVLTMREGIELLTQGYCVSIALNRKFALALSKYHEDFDLLYGIAKVGTVSLDGVIAFNKGSEDLLQDMQVA